jgi:formylmethanofuran dehydrogenase subunit C
MTRGRITVMGHAGMHLGAYMKGGSIEVTGDASDWVGGEMKGGLIHIRGSAGGQVGAAYRGSQSGMKGGTILVEGSAGIELGMRMRRGVIAVRGAVRDFAGLQMKGGTIVLMGGAEIRTGAWMVRGTIVSLTPLRLLPTFAFACAYNPTFLRLYGRRWALPSLSRTATGRTGATRETPRSPARAKSSSGSPADRDESGEDRIMNSLTGSCSVVESRKRKWPEISENALCSLSSLSGLLAWARGMPFLR